MIIYKATNLINGNIYIGQTIFSLEVRKKDHIKCSQSNSKKQYFHKALKKYGPDNFRWEVVDKTYNHDKLNQLEIFYIGYYDTYNNGYNMTLGGEGKSGWIPTIETKRKMSEAKIGKINSKEHNKKISESKKGYITKEETKRKRSESMKGKKHDSKNLKKLN